MDNLYNDLMELCDDNDAFYYSDRVVGNKVYRVFSYRLVSWTEMQRHNAKNCRGTTFLVSQEGNNLVYPVLVSLPPEKFHNYHEGNVDHSKHTIGCSMTKLDGSLISTVMTHHEFGYGGFILKSKTSFESEQVIAATKWLDKLENSKLKYLLSALNEFGYTVNLEFTSPENRIVLPYQETKLTILNVRSIKNDETFGVTYYGDLLCDLIDYYCIDINYIKDYLVDYTNLDTDDHSIIEKMQAEEVGEGYVIEIQDPEGSYMVKVKNHKYLSLHKTKDSINTPAKLFEAVVSECSDDLRAMFGDDQYSLDKINAMEAYVIPKFNGLITSVELFYQHNKELDRKSYAIESQKQWPEIMSLLMNLYLGRKNDYKEFAIKHMENLFHINQLFGTGVTQSSD